MYTSGKKVDLNLGGNNCSRPCHNTHGLVGIAQEDVLTYSVTVEPLPGIGSKQMYLDCYCWRVPAVSFMSSTMLDMLRCLLSSLHYNGLGFA